MKEKARFLGLDVHAETIAVAVAEPDGEVRSLGTIAKLAESIRKLVRKLGPAEHLRACYEAGPTGYVLYWQLAELGVKCEVIAPTPVPVKAGAPTDRSWSVGWDAGDRVVRLEQAIAEAVKLASPELQEVVKDLQALRGIAQISAVTIAAELGNISRFEGARQLMGYSGAVPSEDSSGKRTRRGSITKTGNAHLRRIVVEAAWSYRLRPGVGPGLRRRQEGVSEEIKEIAWKAQHRLHKRYLRLAAAGQRPEKDHHCGGARTVGLHLGHRDQGGNGSQAADSGLTRSKNEGKGKNVPKNERTKTTPRMNNAAEFEDRASSSRSMHEGESSSALCDRLSRTRDTSQRQLPTDHDYAVSTREYQTDQSSLKSVLAAAGPVLDKRQKQRQRQKQPHRFAGVDRVTPYQGIHFICGRTRCSRPRASTRLWGPCAQGSMRMGLGGRSWGQGFTSVLC